MGAWASGGTTLSWLYFDAFSEIFSSAEFADGLAAAFLLKSTGTEVASWTRSRVPREVIGVMAATMWGSLDTMVRTLGGAGPRSMLLETEDRHFLEMQIEPNSVLLLVAPRSVGRRQLQHEARRILDRLPEGARSGAARPAPRNVAP